MAPASADGHTEDVPAVDLLVWLGLALGPVLLTCVGMRARGHGAAGALAGGLLFPLTWVVWYVVDEHPYQPRR